MKAILKAAAAAVSLATVALVGPHGAKAQGYDWSGLYIGANAGWMQTDATATWPNTAFAQRSFEHSTSAGVFGGHFGIQQQFGNVLLGLEFAGSGGKSHFDSGSPNSGCPNPAFTCDVSRISGLYQAGLRLGFTFNNWLVFATGGYATGSVDTRSFNNATRLQFDSTTQRHDGWYLGGGIEYGLNRNIVLGLEYQHISLGSTLHPSPLGNLADARNVDADADIIRARLTWLLNFERYRPEPLK